MAVRVSLLMIKWQFCLLIYHGDYSIIPINFILGENIAKYSWNLAEIRNSKWPPGGCLCLIDLCKMTPLSHHGDYIIRHIVFLLYEHVVKWECHMDEIGHLKWPPGSCLKLCTFVFALDSASGGAPSKSGWAVYSCFCICIWNYMKL